jgi:hypothetical protein
MINKRKVKKETDCYNSFIKMLNIIFDELNVSLKCEDASSVSKSPGFKHIPDLIVFIKPNEYCIERNIAENLRVIRETAVFLVEIKKDCLKNSDRAQIVDELTEFLRQYPARFMVMGVLSSLDVFEVYCGFYSGRDRDGNLTIKVSLLTSYSIEYNWDSDRKGLVELGCLLSTNYNWYGTICIPLDPFERLCWNLIKYYPYNNNNNNNNNNNSTSSNSPCDLLSVILNCCKKNEYISSCFSEFFDFLIKSIQVFKKILNPNYPEIVSSFFFF